MTIPDRHSRWRVPAISAASLVFLAILVIVTTATVCGRQGLLPIPLFQIEVGPENLVKVDRRLLELVRVDYPDYQAIAYFLATEPEEAREETELYGPPLVYAQHSDIRMIELLLQHGADPLQSATTGIHQGQFGLMVAVRQNSPESLDMQLGHLGDKAINPSILHEIRRVTSSRYDKSCLQTIDSWIESRSSSDAN